MTERNPRQQPVRLSPMDEIRLVEHQCERCFKIEALDMQTRHGGESIDQQARIEPVDVNDIDEPGLGVGDDMLGGF